MELRPYQLEVLDQVREKLRAGSKRIIISAPTGAGKTEIAMAMLQAAIAKGSRVSFIVDRRTLVHQTSRRFSAADIEHGILMGDDTIGTNHCTRVESAQTIQSRGLREGTDLYVLDECHELRPEIVRLIAESGARLIGLTATPFPAQLADPYDKHLPVERKNGDSGPVQQEGTPPRYEGMVTVTTTDSLIAQEYLAPFDVVSPVAAVDTTGIETQGGEYRKATLKDRIMRIVGDIVPTWEAQLAERYDGRVQPTIVFGATVDDAEAIYRAFRAAGYSTGMVSSREDEDDNKRVIAAYSGGEFDVLVNCAMLSRGFDAPRTTILVDAYPMRKILTPIQRYGRVMRQSPGKQRALIIDHAENWLHMREQIMRFYSGGPSWPPPESAHKVARDKKPDRDMICKSCRTVIPSGDAVCPGCGKARPAPPVRTFGGKGSKLERVDGTLRLIDSVTGAVSRYGGELWAEVCTAALAQCGNDLARARNRALASYKAITGNWPKSAWKTQDRPADPAVVDLMERNFKAWKIARDASRRSIDRPAPGHPRP